MRNGACQFLLIHCAVTDNYGFLQITGIFRQGKINICFILNKGSCVLIPHHDSFNSIIYRYLKGVFSVTAGGCPNGTALNHYCGSHKYFTRACVRYDTTDFKILSSNSKCNPEKYTDTRQKK